MKKIQFIIDPSKSYYLVEDVHPTSYKSRLSVVAHSGFGRIGLRLGGELKHITAKELAEDLEKHYKHNEYTHIRLLFCYGADEPNRLLKFFSIWKEPVAATISKAYPKSIVEAYKGTLLMKCITKISSSSLNTSKENMHYDIPRNDNIENNFRINSKNKNVVTLNRVIDPALAVSALINGNKDEKNKLMCAMLHIEETKVSFEPVNYKNSDGPYFWLDGKETKREL
ncbi:hypothetical protein [Xenorhabdus griffiniae]|uniref:Uncharacterized protein n=1 Tax=Xenorhabdus griffiniae TaxID=351672 RepID=A0ABY9XD42_9GAMM|nr:hypothetical protein [Xenorhabdus griffiniae]MBD1229163.1 hypothetical protein [Xenorhabdus griffiniae]MBE8587803.1 hypothetical protein [Xenorhabdus griffiniae]WMV70829.1 hypothetical protein QL128_11370 [Xenorhabdus griffiniae]WNH00505.1 hypothetical protein QL112_011375 [Xenorhabdus griffiniae]